MSDEKALTTTPAQGVPKEVTELVSRERLLARDRLAVDMGIARVFYDSGLFPSCRNAEQAYVVLATGKELGLPASTSMRTIDIVEGRPMLSADLMVALVKRHGQAKFEYRRDMDNGSVELTATRGDTGEIFQTRWDRERVERGGINQGKHGIKHNWRAHEIEMLKHRCDAEACRALWPDVVGGMYCHEEREEIEEAEFVERPTARTDAVRQSLGLPPQQEPESPAEATTEPETVYEGEISDEEIPQ